MAGERSALFDVPVDGQSVRCEMHMTGRGEVYKITALRPMVATAAYWRFEKTRDICDFLSALLGGGMPFDALATCRHSQNLIGAVIEGAWLRRGELFPGLAA